MSRFEPFKLGKYLMLQRLGRGGMAEVYLAKTEGVGRFEKKFAVKRLISPFCDDPQFIAMFEQEANVFCLLDHPNIAQVYDFVREDDTYLLVMEFIDGPTAAQMFAGMEPVEGIPRAAVAAFVVSKVLEGLDYAHRKTDESTGLSLDIVHRDISPQNIMVKRNGEIKIIDFGIARMALSRALTRPGTIKGKIGYCSPEQLEDREVDCRTDLYSSAVVLYEFLTGQHLFEAEGEGALIRKIIDGVLPDLSADPRIPSQLAPLLQTALSSNPEERMASAEIFRAGLTSFLESQYAGFGQTHLADLLAKTQPATHSETSSSYSSAIETKSLNGSVPLDKVKTTLIEMASHDPVEESPQSAEAPVPSLEPPVPHDGTALTEPSEEYLEMVTQVTSLPTEDPRPDSGATRVLDTPEFAAAAASLQTEAPEPVSQQVVEQSLSLAGPDLIPPKPELEIVEDSGIDMDFWATRVRSRPAANSVTDDVADTDRTLVTEPPPAASSSEVHPTMEAVPTPPPSTGSFTERAIIETAHPYQEPPDFSESAKRWSKLERALGAGAVLGLVVSLYLLVPRFLTASGTGEREAAVGNPAALGQKPAPHTCLLNLSSDPAVAEVLVNNEHMGQTPTVIKVPCSEQYQLRLEKVGFEPTVRQVAANEPLDKWYVTLHPATVGQVQIWMDFNATLFVDDNPAGQIAPNQTFKVLVSANQPHRLRVENSVLGINQVWVMRVGPEKVLNTSLLLSDLLPSDRRHPTKKN